ncbi:MAG: hypothetical protein JWM64_2085 [Frankiales bacterium]|nr:hypothetical protein [Frankiales bacterium]
MVALGLVLLVLAALLTLGIVFSNTDPANAAAFGVTLSNVSLGGLFLVGVVTGAVAMLGLTLFLGGGIRRRHKRVEAKREVRSVRGEAETLAEENARLAAELEQSRSAGSTGTATYPADEQVAPKRGVFGR